jgi:hypothetical protein
VTALDQAAEAAVFDLDALEREDPAKDYPPFAITFKGRRIVLKDPVEIDWQVLIEVSQNPGTFAAAAMSNDDRKFFEKHTVPTWKLEKLVDAYTSHYDIEEPGKAD